jgi:hypothetical protein
MAMKKNEDPEETMSVLYSALSHYPTIEECQTNNGWTSFSSL